MKNFKKILLSLVFAAFMVAAIGMKAQAEELPVAAPSWFDAKFYAETYRDVAVNFSLIQDQLGGFESAMWYHYRNLGVNELRKPAENLAGGYRPSQAAASVNTGATQAVPSTTGGIYCPTGIPCNGSPYYILVDRTANICHVLTVGEDGTYCRLINSMFCSTGKEGHATPAGTFTIYEHTAGGGWVYMVDGTWGLWGMRFRQGGYMFHSVCFAKKGDLTPIPEEVAALGSRASRGCVRLSVEDCKWLYNTVPDGTLVTIGN